VISNSSAVARLNLLGALKTVIQMNKYFFKKKNTTYQKMIERPKSQKVFTT